MKKRLLPALLALCMMLSLVPVMALAATAETAAEPHNVTITVKDETGAATTADAVTVKDTANTEYTVTADTNAYKVSVYAVSGDTKPYTVTVTKEGYETAAVTFGNETEVEVQLVKSTTGTDQPGEGEGEGEGDNQGQNPSQPGEGEGEGEGGNQGENPSQPGEGEGEKDPGATEEPVEVEKPDVDAGTTVDAVPDKDGNVTGYKVTAEDVVATIPNEALVIEGEGDALVKAKVEVAKKTTFTVPPVAATKLTEAAKQAAQKLFTNTAGGATVKVSNSETQQEVSVQNLKTPIAITITVPNAGDFYVFCFSGDTMTRHKDKMTAGPDKTITIYTIHLSDFAAVEDNEENAAALQDLLAEVPVDEGLSDTPDVGNNGGDNTPTGPQGAWNASNKKFVSDGAVEYTGLEAGTYMVEISKGDVMLYSAMTAEADGSLNVYCQLGAQVTLYSSVNSSVVVAAITAG